MQELVSQSDLVALVEVVGQSTRFDARGRVVTDVRLRIEDAMRGDVSSGDEVVMVRFGGAVGDIGMRIEGEPAFVDGTRYLVFGRRWQGVYRPVGMSQGVLRVDRDARGERVLPGGGGLSLVRRTSEGRVVPAAAAMLRPRSLDAVVGEIRDLLAR